MKKILAVLAALGLFNISSIMAGEVETLSGLDGTPERLHLAATLEKGLKSYGSVNDYKAIFQKQERSGGVLGPKESIFLKFEKPFKIFMEWTNTDKKGLEVLYERGKRQGKLAIHKPGLLLGLAPVIYLDQDSPWVREGSESYNIEDAGIGPFLNDFSKAVLKGAQENKLELNANNDAEGETWNVTFKGSNENSGYFAYRVVVHFEKKSALPDRMQLFDWQDVPMGNYAYENLELNVGPKDPEFEKLALRKIYQLYQPATKTILLNNFNGKNLRAKQTAG